MSFFHFARTGCESLSRRSPCHSRHYPEPQVLHRAIVGGLACFVAVVDLVLDVELLDGHARNCLLLVLVLGYQGLLQRIRFR